MSRLAPLVLFVFLLGCERAPKRISVDTTGFDEYRIRFLDESGAAITSGTIRLPPISIEQAAEGDDDSWHEALGTWDVKDLEMLKPAAYANGGSDYRRGGYEPNALALRHSSEGNLSINLNPDREDDNVYLNGQFTDAGLEGTWAYCSQAGPVSNGEFDAVRIEIED